jgi:hypothetical protein
MHQFRHGELGYAAKISAAGQTGNQLHLLLFRKRVFRKVAINHLKG